MLTGGRLSLREAQQELGRLQAEVARWWPSTRRLMDPIDGTWNLGGGTACVPLPYCDEVLYRMYCDLYPATRPGVPGLVEPYG